MEVLINRDKSVIVAALEGVRDFVVPSNKPEFVNHYRTIIEDLCGSNYRLYAPGFITQGGDITEMAKVAGDKWHAIVGSAIYKAPDIKAAAELVTYQTR